MYLKRLRDAELLVAADAFRVRNGGSGARFRQSGVCQYRMIIICVRRPRWWDHVSDNNAAWRAWQTDRTGSHHHVRASGCHERAMANAFGCRDVGNRSLLLFRFLVGATTPFPETWECRLSIGNLFLGYGKWQTEMWSGEWGWRVMQTVAGCVHTRRATTDDGRMER